jgi:hypothetical protein
LQAQLEGLLAELGEEVTDLLLTARNDVTIGRVVDGIGHLAEHRFHLLTHGCHKRRAIQFGHRFHSKASSRLKGIPATLPTLANLRRMRQRNLPHPSPSTCSSKEGLHAVCGSRPKGSNQHYRS